MPPVENTAGDDPLARSISCLKGPSARRLEQLEKLGCKTIRELLFHFPRQYEDLSRLRRIQELQNGQVQMAQGEIVEMDSRETASGVPLVSIILSDGGNVCLEGVWFNQPYISSRFRYGQHVAFIGKVKWFRDRYQMSNPRFQRVEENQGASEPGILPNYPLADDLSNEQLRKIIRQAVDRFGNLLVDPLPEELRRQHGWLEATQAIREVHFPTAIERATAARNRFVYEEFLVLQLGLALRRRELRDRQRAPRLIGNPEVDARIRRLFPFELTGDQNKVIEEIRKDLGSERPMQRLLQADVGAGKTAVAVYALLVAVANRCQAAIMAPTEVLVLQHWNTLERYLAASRVRRLLLTGSLKGDERRAALASIRKGEVDLVVGTQALVQQDVQFAQLGLVVIDEQHKFGVNQRAQIRRLGVDPHYLVMTATPIPRTMALTVFGDLDVSTIRAMPPGRQPVQTRLFPLARRQYVHEQLSLELRKGRQAFVVCPLVEESEHLDVKAAEETCEELRRGALREYRVGLLHGRMGEAAKASVMEQFRRRDLDVLVATSVIEVGVDVPGATLMVIEHAERFGLSQLHQFRGRICRGTIAGLCWLLADPATEDSRRRLETFVRTRDGFALAEADARQRGAGQLFGTRQHGTGELRLADPINDAALLQWARKDALNMVLKDPGLRGQDHVLLRRAVLEQFGKALELAEVG
jgi:ATP-dependent DNA helicase RecG